MKEIKNYSIRVQNLTKAYKLYEKPVDRLKESLNPFKNSYHKEFFALKDVSFGIKKGETVGILGKNGSGKSTLLKIITGVLNPTEGTVEVNGKVSALLELGAGFNPELTGIENIYFNGTIMGFSKEEMDNKLEDILSFADIGDFVYQPVKMYSSGMFARLAFSVAISVEPDIMIVDEALSVGDMAFQHKCIAKMKSMMEKGVTVLFVSHDTNAVKSLCQKCIYIVNGEVKAYGESKEVADVYLKDLRSSMYITAVDETLETKESPVEQGKLVQEQTMGIFKINPEFEKRVKDNRYGTGGAKIRSIELLNSKNEVKEQFEFNDMVTLRAHIEIYEQVEALNCCFIIRNNVGVDIMGTTTFDENYHFPVYNKGDRVIVDFSFKNNLRGGLSYSIQYTINDTISYQSQKVLDLVDNAIVFQSIPDQNRPIWYAVWHPFEIEHKLV